MATSILTYNFSSSDDLNNKAVAKFYEDSTPIKAKDKSLKCGNSDGKRYCTVMKITVPDGGCNSISFNITDAYWWPSANGGTQLIDNGVIYTHDGDNINTLFKFAITNSDAYDATLVTGDGDGFVNVLKGDHTSDRFYTLTGSVAKELSAGTYYLWLFPAAYDFSKHFRYWILSGQYYKPVVTIVFSGESSGALDTPTSPEVGTTVLWVFDEARGWLQGAQRVFNGISWL